MPEGSTFRVSRAYRKPHAPLRRPSVSNEGTTQRAWLSAPSRGTRRSVLVVLAVLGLASAAFALRRQLLMSAPTCMAGRWHGCFGTENGVLFMMLVGLPLAALVAWALARHRRVVCVASAWRVSLAEVGMVYGTVPVVWLTLMPGSGAGVVPVG